MPARTHLLQLPLLLAGIPATLSETLRQAGLPVAPFRKGTAILSQLGPAAGRFVLYDSRSASSRLDAEAARTRHQTTIDVASLGIDRGERNGVRAGSRRAAATWLENRPGDKAELLLRLKHELERLGGVWLRVADYPFPYKSALLTGDNRCDGEAAHLIEQLDEPCPATAEDAPGESMRRRYEAGLPIVRGTADAKAGVAPASIAAAVACDEFPLMWQTTPEEFARWWRLRQDLVIHVQSHGPRYRIDSQCKADGFRPALELWRGNHVASFPLSSRVIEVNAEGLAFLREEQRHPGGLAAGSASESLPAQSTTILRRQSA